MGIRKYFILFILLFVGPLNLHAQNDTVSNSFILGEFTVSKILDGDTFRFDKLDRPTRLLGVDTEETWKDVDAETKVNDISGRWAEYYAHKKDSSQKPAKIESPFGYKTWQWTKQLFNDVVKVRLETDGLSREKDMYNRYLLYVIAVRADGTEFNYNIECVRQGYSPYFSKYGYSARFHNEFTAAQKLAQDNKLGIWSSSELGYPDYTERLEWWDVRARQIENYHNNFAGKERYYSTLDINDYSKLKEHINDSVIVFGNISRIIKDKDPQIFKLEVSDAEQVDLVIFGKNSRLANDMDLYNPKNYYLYAKGMLTEYKGRLQIIIEDTSQIWSE